MEHIPDADRWNLLYCGGGRSPWQPVDAVGDFRRTTRPLRSIVSAAQQAREIHGNQWDNGPFGGEEGYPVDCEAIDVVIQAADSLVELAELLCDRIDAGHAKRSKGAA